jgi:HEAT repeat protein
MKLWPVALALFAGGVAAGSTELPQKVQDALTLIDSVPSQLELDSAFCPIPNTCGDHMEALQGLATIATDSGSTDSASRNARLHAISALAKYCTVGCDTTNPAHGAHDALYSIITATTGEATGFNAVVLRAAIEAIGPQRVSTDLGLLLTQLQNPSRDIRAAVAHSLRDLCNTEAIVPLRQQQQSESSDQVKQAITEALRVLGQAPCQ